MNKQEIINLSMLMQEVKDFRIENNENHRIMTERLNQINGRVEKNTTFRERIIGSSKFIGVLAVIVGIIVSIYKLKNGGL